MIKDGSTVSIEYTLKLDDGSTAATNVGQDPLSFNQGEKQMLPALEEALAGLKEGDTKSITVAAEDGYGPVDPAAFVEVPVDSVPENARETGTMLISRDEDGQERHVRVHEVRNEVVVIDYNHPLAGQTLHFDLKVVSVA